MFMIGAFTAFGFAQFNMANSVSRMREDFEASQKNVLSTRVIELKAEIAAVHNMLVYYERDYDKDLIVNQLLNNLKLRIGQAEEYKDTMTDPAQIKQFDQTILKANEFLDKLFEERGLTDEELIQKMFYDAEKKASK